MILLCSRCGQALAEHTDKTCSDLLHAEIDTLQQRVAVLETFIRRVLRSTTMAHLSAPLREEARILLGAALQAWRRDDKNLL